MRGPIEAADEMGGDWPTILRAARGGRRAWPRSSGALSRRSPAISRGDRRQGAGVLRALAGLAADPVRRLDRRRCDRAARRRGARLPPVRRQGRMRALPCRLALHRRSLPRHRPARPRSPAAAASRAARRAAWPSRRRACANWRTPRPTCTTARCRRCGRHRRIHRRLRRAADVAPNMNRHLRLTAQEKADLIAFLRSLSSEARPRPHTARRPPIERGSSRALSRLASRTWRFPRPAAGSPRRRCRSACRSRPAAPWPCRARRSAGTPRPDIAASWCVGMGGEHLRW